MSKRKVTVMEKARAGLVLRDPFLATLALRLKLQEGTDLGVPTAATDGVKILVNPEYIEKIRAEHGDAKLPDYAKGLWFHETGHCFALHHVRRGNRDPQYWNWACDIAVDNMGKRGGYLIPDSLADDQYDNMEVEEIYLKLISNSPPKCPQCGAGGDGDGDKSGDNSQGQGDSSDGNDSGNDGQNQGQGCPKCHGNGVPKGCGDVLDYPGRDGSGGGDENGEEKGQGPTSGDLAQEAQNWQVALVQAAQVAKVQGKLPAGFEKLVEEITESNIPWREAIARWLSEVSRNDYDWSMPNRRHMVRGIYLPQLEDETIGEIVVIWDTSGSVSGREAGIMTGEVQGVLQEFNSVNILLIHVDARYQYHEEISSDDIPLKLTPKGGGGTCFKPGFKWLDKQDRDPVGIIYMTDGECNTFPEEAPDVPVIWVLTQKPRWTEWDPPFGETIYATDL